MGVGGDTSDADPQFSSVDWEAHGSPGDIETFYATLNYSAANMQYFLFGTSPVMIRSVMLDYTQADEESFE